MTKRQPPKGKFQEGLIAGIEGQRDLTRGYVDPRQLLRTTDSLLLDRGETNRLWEQVLEDSKVRAAIGQRVVSLAGKETQYLPASASAKDRAICDFVRQTIEGLGRWDDIFAKTHFQALFFGLSVAELQWLPSPSGWGWADLKVRNHARFDFLPSGELRLVTPVSRVFGEALPPQQFWHVSMGCYHDDEPRGVGLAHWLFWLVTFRRSDWELWLQYLEDFSLPTPIGYYPPDLGKEEQQKLKRALQSIRRGAGGILPEGVRLDFAQASRSGTADYAAFSQMIDCAIDQLILGQTMTSSDGGSYAQASVHYQVRDDLLKGDADTLCGAFNKGPIRWLVEANFGAQQAYPQVWRDLDGQEDLNSRAERDERLFKIGYRLGPEAFATVYGEGYELVSRPVGAADTPPPQFAAFGGDTVDRLADRLGQESGLADWVEVIRGELDRAGSLEVFADRLLDLAPDLSSTQFIRVMADALHVAALAGQEEALEDGQE